MSIESSKKLLLAAVILLSVGFLGGRYVAPPKEITKVEVQEREVIKKDIQTVVREVVRPDGTKETTTTTNDRSTEKKDRQYESIVQKAEKQWFVTAGASKKQLNPTEETIYQVMVQRRILGPAFAGLSVDTNKQVGLVISAEF